MNAAHVLEAASTTPSLQLVDLLTNLLISAGLTLVVGLHYRFFGSTLANRDSFIKVFPFVALTTTLLISIVKSSLALSLGLVGALSIVRFRTPVKEPEELAYLFLSITIGLGLGADFRLPTTVAVVLILAVMGAVQLRSKKRQERNLYLSIGLDVPQSTGASEAIARIHELLAKHCSRLDLRRMDNDHGHLELVYYVDMRGAEPLGQLAGDFQTQFPAARVTLLDQSRLPGV